MGERLSLFLTFILITVALCQATVITSPVEVNIAGSTLGREIQSQFSLVHENVKNFAYKFQYTVNDSLSNSDLINDKRFLYILTESPQNVTGVKNYPMFTFGISVVHNSEMDFDKRLVLDRETVAGIFAGSITKWNDAKIQATNAGVTLPDQDIVLVVRSDASETTRIFTRALSKFSSTIWTSGTVSVFPTGSMSVVTATSNSDLISKVEETPFSIGYVIKKNGFMPAEFNLINQANGIVSNDVNSIKSASEAVNIDTNLQRGVPIVQDLTDAPNNGSWPISGYTYMMVRTRNDDDDCLSYKGAQGLLAYYYTAPTSVNIVTGGGYFRFSTASIIRDLNTITCNGETLASIEDPSYKFSSASTLHLSVSILVATLVVLLL